MSVLKTPEFRGSFVTLFEARRPAPDAVPEYSITLSLPKDDPETKAFLKKYDAMGRAAYAEKFARPPKKMQNYIKDGDEEDREEWEGCWVLKAKNKKYPPGVSIKNSDGTLSRVDNPEDVKSGDYFKITVDVFPWKHPTGGSGYSMSLRNVLKTRDGEPFGAGSSSGEMADDFADDGELAEEEEDDFFA